MTIPYDYDQTNIDHLRAVVAEQEQTIEYLHERCKAEEVESAKLRELLDFALPIAMYAASTEEGDRIRELLREVDV